MKKRFLTLVELMIVIVLITVIGSVVAYNLRGSLEEGKRFKTRQGGAQVYNILMLEKAKGTDITDWQETVKGSNLAKRGKDLIYDGWGELYSVEWEDGDYQISSDRYDEYLSSKGRDDDDERYFR
jgi:type II secretory pathway pseudopilin PulG